MYRNQPAGLISDFKYKIRQSMKMHAYVCPSLKTPVILCCVVDTASIPNIRRPKHDISYTTENGNNINRSNVNCVKINDTCKQTKWLLKK